jgi:hypothetical protein
VLSQLPQKIFTVQDEPPSWDDEDDAGLESVSEPDNDDSSIGAGEDNNNDGGDDGLISADTTLEAIHISSPGKGRSMRDDILEMETERGRGGSTPSGGFPPGERPRLEGNEAGGRGRLDSWVTPIYEGEAPNGKPIV